MQGEARLRGL